LIHFFSFFRSQCSQDEEAIRNSDGSETRTIHKASAATEKQKPRELNTMLVVNCLRMNSKFFWEFFVVPSLALVGMLNVNKSNQKEKKP
jgi:hypothetical protein